MEDFLLLDKQLNSEQKLLRDKVRNFVRSKVNPKISAAFEEGRFLQEFIKDFAEMGLLGLVLDTKYGGAGSDFVSYGLVCQELEYGDSSLRSFFSVQNSLCIYPILTFGNETQRKTWLLKLANGEAIGCFALSEIDAGSNPANLQTTAKKITDGWELTGSKKWITNAPIADFAIIWAKTANNIEAFIVEKNCPGFSTKEIKHKMSLRTSVTGEINLDKCIIPDTHHLSATSKGLSCAFECLTQARYGIAWGAIGAAMSCFETALEYCKSRRQYNKVLAGFQLVQKDLADMLCEISKAKCTNLQIGKLKDAGLHNYAMISMAKMNACKTALQVARRARDLLGANGITLNYPVIRHMQNLEAVSTYEGTDNIHHLILGKHLTGIAAFE